MEFSEVIKTRQSCRNYSGEPVSRDDLEKIIQGALFAPSACNSQPWAFSAVYSPDKVKEVASACKKFGFNKFVDKVGAFIVVELREPKLKEGVTKMVGSRYFADNDIGIVTGFITLCAKDLGLDTCIMGMFDKKAVKEALSMPDKTELKLVIAVGKCAEDDTLRIKSRKPIEELAKFF